MAAVLANGITWIENAALEPEIVDLVNFINKMGAKISGAGTNVIKIEGVDYLSGTEYTPIPDRIEAGTYMIAVAATAGEAVINNIIPEHLKSITAKLEESGAIIEEEEHSLSIKREGKIKPVYIKTLPYPGFPTDMQAQIMAYLSSAVGTSIISESVFENRFMHVQELLRMGADIKTEGKSAIIRGVKELTGARVRASDLRAGAALIIAGISAQGKTIVAENEHIERGYEDIDKKLNLMGAQIYLN
jgi:UDP-N-acetylglucosamine 1-carboxyvinyltransferase